MTPAAGPAAKPSLVACGTVSFAYFTYIGLFNPFAPLWFKEMGLSIFAMGMLASLSSWTRLYAPYMWGTLADRKGDRARLIRWACTGTLLSALAFLLPLNLLGLSVAVFAMFSFNAAIVPLTETLVAAQLVTRDGGMDARRYGRVRVWGSIGFMAAVLVFGAVFEHIGMRYFPWLVLASLLGLMWAAWRLPPQHEELKHLPHEAPPPVMQVLRRPEVAWFFAGITLTVMAHASLYAFLSLYLDELHYSKPVVGALWAVSVVVEIVWFTWQGRWLDRLSLHGWLLLAALVSALRFGVTASLGDTLPVLVAVQCLHAITFAAQHTACIALISRYFPGRLRGRGQALYSLIGYGLSGVIGGLGGGALSSHWGYASVFWAATVAALASAWCCWLSMKLHRNANPSVARSPLRHPQQDT